MEKLSEKTCVPCRGGIPPLTPEQLPQFGSQVPDWVIVEAHHIERSFLFVDFASALAFVNAVGAMAEEQGHHPDIFLAWGKVKVTVWTHKINGLTESDFIFAARTDALAAEAEGLR